MGTARVGRYELVRELGRGGAGAVWEAVLHGPAGFRKRVALKLLHRGGDALVREARLGGLLRHPNLVDVYELGRDGEDGAWYCAMELVPGRISDHVPLPPRAVVEVGLQVCAGLAHAHGEVGLVHLDLKPSNLLLDGATVKVADLGIALARGFEGDGEIRGTPGYMPPEQFAGWPCDARSDVYALGVVLHELATGSLPGEVDCAWLAPVVDRCLEPRAERRFPDMDAVAQALAALPAVGAGLAEMVGDRRAIPARPRPAGELSTEPDAFVGREALLASLNRRLGSSGLVTLKGPAGIGKTRTARQVVRSWKARGGATMFCALEDVRTEAGLQTALARAMGVEPGSEDGLAHALAAGGPCLVVLDNFEQIVALAPVVDGWRAAAPEARFLLTSREPLRLPAETVVELEPLPDEDALALLLDRVRARGIDVPADDDLRALAADLDGLPLAIELAAGRLGAFTPAQVRARLSDRLRLLTTRGRGSKRTATLRGALDWSWELLDDAERATLAQLTVFRGGFTLELAEDVVALPDDVWVLDVVQSLVERSLLHRRGGRFGMLEAVRAYASEHLDDPSAVEVRHGHAMIREAGPGPSLAELDNLVAATLRAVGRGDPVVAARACDAAIDVGERTVPVQTQREWLEAVLALDLDEPARASLEVALSQVLCRSGPVEPALPLAEAGLARARAAGSPETMRRAVQQHASCLILLGRFDEAERSLHDAGVDPSPVPSTWGNLERARGRLDASLVWYRRALVVARASGVPARIGTALSNLALVCADLHRYDEAATAIDEALEIERALGNRRMQAVLLSHRAGLRRDCGQLHDALVDVAESLRIHRELGQRLHEAVALGTRGRLQLAVGRIDLCIADQREAVAIVRALENPRSLLLALNSLAVALHLARQLDDAEPCYREALALAERLDHATFADMLRTNFAAMLVDRDEPEEAERLLRQVIASSTDAERLCSALTELVEIALDRGDAATALELGPRALDHADEDVAARVALHGAASVAHALRDDLAASDAALARAKAAARPSDLAFVATIEAHRALVLGDRAGCEAHLEVARQLGHHHADVVRAVHRLESKLRSAAGAPPRRSGGT